MKTSLLLTTALVATVATTNAFANPTIVTDSSYFNEGNDPHIAIKGELSLVKEGMDEGGLTTYPIQYTIKAGHTVDLDTTGKYGKFDDSRLDWVNENVKMTGGTVNIIGGDGKQHEPGLHGNGVNISGGTINITNGSVFDDSEAGASGFTMTDGTIKMNAKGSFIGSSQGGNVNISGGTIEVNGGSSLDKPNIGGANVIIGDTTLSNGKLDINDNSNLIVISKDTQIQENGDIIADGNLNVTGNGAVNLKGTLVSNVTGNGHLNFNNSNAKVDGLVEGSKVAFNNGIYDLDKAIRDRTLVKYSNENPDTGEVENFEFENLQLDSLNIAKDATVNMKNEDIFTRLESADSLVINGKLNMDNSDVEAFDIKIENATIISKTSPDVEIDDNHGIWGGRNTVVKNSIVTLDNSYLSSNNLTINGSTIVAKNGSELENHACTEQAKMTITDSNINLSDRSSILAQASDGKYNIVGGDLDITSSKIDAEGGSEIGLGHNADMNIAGNSIINMDYRNVKAENAHDGGILHEGQSGDININGGQINLAGDVAKIERGGYDSDWVYAKDGTPLMYIEEFWKKAGTDISQATDEQIKNAGLDPQNVDRSYYHVSEGNININGGQIALSDGARISTTAKNTGDINISGGTVKAIKNKVYINTDGEVKVSGTGILDVADGAILSANSLSQNSANKAISVIETGKIDLSGSLIANVKGNGNLNFNNSNAKVDGNVSGTNLAFNADHSVSKAITGTIDNLQNLDVNKGTLNVDENLNNLQNINVKDGANLTSQEYEISTNNLTAGNGNITINGNMKMVDQEFPNANPKGHLFSENTILNGTNFIANGANLNLTNTTLDKGATLKMTDSFGLMNNATITDGKLIMDKSINDANNINLQKGSVELSGQSCLNTKEFEMNDGTTLKLQGESGLFVEDVNETTKLAINGGEIILNDRSDIVSGIVMTGDNSVVEYDNGKKSAEIDISGNTKISADHSYISQKGSADIKISGGEINLTNKAKILHEGVTGNIDMSNGVINVSDSNILKGYFENSDVTNTKKDTKINLNISGGELNIKSGVGRIISMKGNTGTNNITGGTINIADGSELQVFKSDTDIYSDNMKFGEKDKLTLGSNGTININGKLVANVEGDGNLNINSSNAKVDGNVEGTNVAFNANHSMSQAFGGTVDGLNTLSVNKGTFTYDKKATNLNKVDIKDNAILNIGNKTLSAKNVNFERNSTLALQVSNMDQYGKISADTINVSNENTTMKVTVDNGVIKNDETKTFDFLAGNVTGDFTNKIADNSRYTIKKNQDNLFEITGSATANDVAKDAGGSANNTGTAEAWDTVSSSSNVSQTAKDVADSLNKLSQEATTAEGKKAYIDALTALAPETSPQVQQTQNEVTSQIFDVVGQHLSGSITYNDKQGASSGDSVSDKGTMWVQTIMNKSELDDNRDIKGFDSESSGIAFGFDKKINDETKVGIGYGYTNTEVDGYFRDTDIDTHTAIVYGEYKPSNWYVNATASYGWSDYSEDKNVAGNNVKADYDVETFGLQTMAGVEMALDKAIVTPEIGLRYIHIAQEAYRDSSDQSVTSNDSDILTGVIGTKVSSTYEMENGMTLTPEAKLAMTYDMTNDKSGSTVTLANGSAYNVSGEALDRFGIEVGAGLKTEYNDNIELSIGYEGKYRDDYENHTGILNAKYKF